MARTGRLKKQKRPDGDESLSRCAEVIGTRWALAVLVALAGSPYRFNELHRQLPSVPARSLVRVLSKLERLGIIERSVGTERPPSVRYSLAPDKAVRDLIAFLSRWSRKWCR